MRSTILGFAAGAALTLAGPAASADVCRDWIDAHAAHKTRLVRHYLLGAPERELSSALFEMLQLEAYLTSCELPERVTRCQLVGWRLAERAPDEYASAVLDSVLADAGFDVELRELAGGAAAQARLAGRPQR